jgi:hypothetical protein
MSHSHLYIWQSLSFSFFSFEKEREKKLPTSQCLWAERYLGSNEKEKKEG